MIQRIQTVFLILAAVSMALLFVNSISFLSVDPADNVTISDVMLADEVLRVNDHIILLSLVLLCIALPVFIVFLFRNRKLQMKLGRLNVALVIITIVMSLILFYQAYQVLPDATRVTVEFGYLIPVVSILFLVLAIRNIRKDEKLVRSADRLR